MAYYESEIPDPDARMLGWELPAWDGPTPVLLQALALSQVDLDAAGLGMFRISLAVAGRTQGDPTVNVPWRGTWTADSLVIEEQDLAGATVDVAGQLAQGLIELEGVYWPTCPSHLTRARAQLTARGDAVWCCTRRGFTHELCEIGHLASLSRRKRNQPLWRPLERLARP